MLTDAAWRHVAWRQGTKGPLAAEFAARRVRPAEGEQLRNGQHAPGEEVWLVGERRATGEHKYYLSNLPVGTRSRCWRPLSRPPSAGSCRPSLRSG